MSVYLHTRLITYLRKTVLIFIFQDVLYIYALVVFLRMRHDNIPLLFEYL